MDLGRNFIVPFNGNYLRIFAIACTISAVLVFNVGVDPSIAFSQKESALKKLKSTTVNFHEVAPGIYRSGLISKAAVPALKELGIKTVISFDNNVKRAQEEKEFLERAGVESILIPWSGWDYPKDEVITKTLELMESPQRKPVLVHCKHGQERTGVVVACWRVAYQHWSAEEAYQEMRTYGFRPFRYGHLRKYVYDFARRHGDQNFRIGSSWEQMKTSVLSFIYQLRKLNPNLAR